MLTPHNQRRPQQSYGGRPPPAQQHPQQYNRPRPVSSIYSQPSPEAAVFAAQQLRNEVARRDPLEISPPSSPDIASPKQAPNAGDVSPIDELHDTAQQVPQQYQQQHQHGTPPKQSRSNIPMMRRERRKNSNAAAIQSISEPRSQEQLQKQPRPYGNDVRWDPRTGEPTTSAKGRPSQVNPQEYVQGLTHRTADQVPPQSKPSSNPAAAFRDRLRPVQRQSSASPQPEPVPQQQPSRPGWRGASGRTALVAPVKDNMGVPPLRILPRANNQRVTSGRMPTSLSPVESFGSGSVSSPLGASTTSPPATSTITSGPVTTPARQTQMQPDGQMYNSQPRSTSTAYPTPPSEYPAASPSIPLVQEPEAMTTQQPPPLQIPSNAKATRRKPTRPSLDGRAETPTGPSAEPSPREVPSSAPGHTRNGSAEWVQPPSRFSITTYATSHHTSTPQPSVDEFAPPLPTPPPNGHGTPTPAPRPAPISILDRGRPIVAGYENSPRPSPTTEPMRIMLDSPYYTTSPTTSSSTLKPRPATKMNVLPSGAANLSTLSLVSNSSIDTKDKSLPPAPPEALATDRVAELNAMHQSLANRRINLNKAIHQMTELMPMDNILASDAVRRKREMEKMKVEALRTELADVERQSYEIGLKLHRAYKRLDRDAEYEPTTLWVRRVTG
ncbi:hypothetical protein F5Y16DRAFT_347219 [Xylariaceae sp. FL0255]|nr:hypothetical protein F5Y16DRAFT_347219 [Xylariaceae sp. FL0255]